MTRDTLEEHLKNKLAWLESTRDIHAAYIRLTADEMRKILGLLGKQAPSSGNEQLNEIFGPGPTKGLNLSVEQREAILEVMYLARDEGLPGTAEMLASILEKN